MARKVFDMRMPRRGDVPDEVLQRARPGTWKLISVPPLDAKKRGPEGMTLKPEYPYLGKNHEGDDVIVVRAGFCPCATCGHTWMHECDAAGCDCCSPECT